MTTAAQKTRATRKVPAMTSRHFYFIADTLASVYDDYPELTTDQRALFDEIAMRFTRRLRASNAQFKADRFLEACKR